MCRRREQIQLSHGSSYSIAGAMSVSSFNSDDIENPFEDDDNDITAQDIEEWCLDSPTAETSSKGVLSVDSSEGGAHSGSPKHEATTDSDASKHEETPTPKENETVLNDPPASTIPAITTLEPVPAPVEQVLASEEQPRAVIGYEDLDKAELHESNEDALDIGPESAVPVDSTNKQVAPESTPDSKEPSPPETEPDAPSPEAKSSEPFKANEIEPEDESMEPTDARALEADDGQHGREIDEDEDYDDQAQSSKGWGWSAAGWGFGAIGKLREVAAGQNHARCMSLPMSLWPACSCQLSCHSLWYIHQLTVANILSGRISMT